MFSSQLTQQLIKQWVNFQKKKTSIEVLAHLKFYAPINQYKRPKSTRIMKNFVMPTYQSIFINIVHLQQST